MRQHARLIAARHAPGLFADIAVKKLRLELAAAIAKLATQTFVLNGEVAVYDEKLVSRFHLLGDDDSGLLCAPSLFIAFDIL